MLAGSASSRSASDIYIWGTVLGRAKGSDASVVQLRWAYKCLGDKLGYATFDWNLKLERDAPLPKKTTLIARGTSKRGQMNVTLPPGDYLPLSDPYECTTERGAGYSQPEIGAPFTVPDYCAWSVSAVRGAVQLEHGSAVKAAKPGSAAAPGDALVTPKSGSASMSSLGKDGTLTLAGGSRLEVDKSQCRSKGGWLVRLETGSATVAVAKTASGSKRYAYGRTDVTASGGSGARWQVRIAKGKTTVHDLAGTVHAGAAASSQGRRRLRLVEGDRFDVRSSTPSDSQKRPPSRERKRRFLPAKMTRSGFSSLIATAKPGGSPRPASRHVVPASCDTSSGGLWSTTATTVEPAAAAATTRGRPVSVRAGVTSSLDGTSSPSSRSSSNTPSTVCTSTLVT